MCYQNDLLCMQNKKKDLLNVKYLAQKVLPSSISAEISRGWCKYESLKNTKCKDSQIPSAASGNGYLIMNTIRFSALTQKITFKELVTI